MPYYHCRKCQHEFEYPPDDLVTCDWCGADNPRVLEQETPLERMCKNPEKILENLKNGSIR